MILVKFRSEELPGCKIKFWIKRVPTRHTYDGPLFPPQKKIPEKCDDDMEFELWLKGPF